MVLLEYGEPDEILVRIRQALECDGAGLGDLNPVLAKSETHTRPKAQSSMRRYRKKERSGSSITSNRNYPDGSEMNSLLGRSDWTWLVSHGQ